MVRKKDPFWEHVQPLEGRFKCNYCQNEYTGGITRVKLHLSGVKGRDIEVCTKVPNEVQAEAYLAIGVPNKKDKTIDNSSNIEARREKINERMKTLQDLVPGCNKVFGKALVLDEIINYIQSLQRLVEVLSLKLAKVNPRIESPIEGFPSKDAGREKISERMKIPQDLVPGCNKIINEALFSAANPSSYSLAEIWPFPINGNAGVGKPSSGGGLGLRMSNLSGFGETTSNRDLSVDESTVTEQSGSRGDGGGRRRRDANSEDESSKLVSTSSGNDVARRKKISERMKILQALVPGCNKVIGKALVLDEIINYIQSLQRQVEFLLMKLEAVNSRMEFLNSSL